MATMKPALRWITKDGLPIPITSEGGGKTASVSKKPANVKNANTSAKKSPSSLSQRANMIHESYERFRKIQKAKRVFGPLARDERDMTLHERFAKIFGNLPKTEKPDPKPSGGNEARASSPTNVSESLVSHLANYEKFRPTWHLPTDNDKLTIGFGHVKLPSDGTKYDRGITEAEAWDLLMFDIYDKGQRHVDRFLADNPTVVLKQHEYDALVSFTFNAGYGWIDNDRTHDLKDILLRGNWTAEDIIGEFLTWTKQTNLETGALEPVSGLYRRRMDEAEMFLYGNYERNETREIPPEYLSKK